MIYCYRECYSSYAYALASTGHFTVRLYFALHLVILLICAEVLNNRWARQEKSRNNASYGPRQLSKTVCVFSLAKSLIETGDWSRSSYELRQTRLLILRYAVWCHLRCLYLCRVSIFSLSRHRNCSGMLSFRRVWC